MLPGTIREELIHFFLSSPRFPEYDLSNHLKISMFHGEQAPCKSKISFEQWLFEDRSVQGLYSEAILRDAIIKSIKGTSANLVIYMGLRVEVIILK